MIAEGLKEFVAVVDRGSVTGAAAALDLPRPTVSKRLARLEDRLGVLLLHRTTRRMTLTEQGQVLYERGRRIVHAVREAEVAVQRHDDHPRGLLRVAIPPRVPEVTFTGWLVAFMEKYPDVSLDVVGTEAHVDLVAEGFDVALFYGEVEDQSLVSRTLAVNHEIAVASPAYLKAHGTPRSTAELSEHSCIIGHKSGIVPNPRWPLLDGGTVAVSGKLMTNHDGLRLQAALRGEGIALVIEEFALPHLKSGELEHVLSDEVGQEARARLVYPQREFLEAKVRAFVDFIVGRVEARRQGG